MKAGLIRITACGLSLMVLIAGGYLPEAAAQPTPQDNPAVTYPPRQIDQLLAPIALYPDSLLAQILMASTYPLEVVEASRWVSDPHNASLRGDQLDAALQQMNWDPSVKSLVPFPSILQMMDSKLDWTQALGNAFLAQQAAVMDSVQRLRATARAAGTLQSTPQELVSTQGQTIVIEPANPQLVYVPYYNPRVVYGRWDYPDYPPVYFPPPPNYGYVTGPGIYFGVGVGVIGALWGWNQWDWSHHNIHIDADRYNRINNYAIIHDNRPQYTADRWQHDPAHRHAVPYGDPAVQQKFLPSPANTADSRRNFRGFDHRAGADGTAPQASSNRPPANEIRTVAPQVQQRPPEAPRGAPPPAVVRRPTAPAFSSFGIGPNVRAQSQRGEASRQSMPPAVAPPQRPPPQQQQQQRSKPANGGGQRGGGREKEHH
ncbi:MAG TPA: DUF3300 domain-containing protein [Telmatospirillum sp.]|nr:DUF3300 domain-containing protein [Telmatospirillum sp.]